MFLLPMRGILFPRIYKKEVFKLRNLRHYEVNKAEPLEVSLEKPSETL